MNFDGHVALEVAPERVWDVLLDVNQFAACMPGVDEVVKIDDETFEGVISARVGPMSGKFNLRAHIVESHPPKDLLTHVDGTDSVTRSTMTADMSMTLTPASAQQTEMTYHLKVDIKGRLAILGDAVLRATAAMMLDEFGKRLQQQVKGGETAIR